MTVTVDTNVLLRAAIRDDEAQARIAERHLRSASQVVIPLQSLCEFVWVSRRVYGLAHAEIATSVKDLLSGPNVVTDRLSVAAGIATMESGGDFADGVIASDGRRSGGEIFLSFDRRAVRLIRAQGYEAKLL